jgi:beta-N-acetylhexosaminidase
VTPTSRPLLGIAAAGALVGALLAPAGTSAHPRDTSGPCDQCQGQVQHRGAREARDARRTAKQVLAEMTLAQQVGQLFMVGTPAAEVDPATQRQIRRLHVGNVMLTGRSYGGLEPPARVSRAMRAQVSKASTDRVRLFVGTDQEGGLVRVLQGPGISDIPTALQQGRWTPHHLRDRAEVWAGQLRRAGVNLNLAPVVDTVPSREAAEHNPPIGVFDREFGFKTTVVARHGAAFVRGMRAGGVGPTAKHFPGLGRVHANTDTSSGVTDRVTRRHDPYFVPFQAAIDAGSPFVMMSTAFYPRLDRRQPAAFSPFIIGTVLRGDLGFRGVVISDDLANARQVAAWTPGQRAVRFIAAGGDIVLSVDPAPVPAMRRALLDRARERDHFRALVRRAALRVLTAKQQHGLLGR